MPVLGMIHRFNLTRSKSAVLSWKGSMLTFTSKSTRPIPTLENPYYTHALKPILDELVNRLHKDFDNYHQERKAVLEAIQYVLNAKILNIHDLKHEPARFFFTLEMLGLAGGGSFATALGVQYLLAGGCLLNLAPPHLKSQYLDDIAKGNIWGCLAMTEIGHGSNVKGVETTARYHPETDEIIIDNFNWVYQQKQLAYHDDHQAQKKSITSKKCWIGNSGYAHISVVIAQLFIPENNEMVCKGPHAFLVPMRQHLSNKPVSGVYVEDMGEKFGLNGVYNGFITYKGVRIPRTNMMMHNIVELKPSGTYKKLVKAPMLSLYSGIQYGRAFISATSHTLMSVSTATLFELRESTRLRPDKKTLATWLARSYGFYYIKKKLYQDMVSGNSDTLATGLKVLTTTYTHKILDDLRYLYTSRQYHSTLNQNLHSAFRDWVASCTYEGDNPVIAQKVPGDILIALMMMTKGFKPGQDIPFLWKIFNQVSPNWFTKKSLLQEMQQGCWYMIFTLALHLQSGFKSDIKPEDKQGLQAIMWNDCQGLIINIALLWTALNVLEEFEHQSKSQGQVMQDLAAFLALNIFFDEFLTCLNKIGCLKQPYDFKKQPSPDSWKSYCLNQLASLYPARELMTKMKCDQERLQERVAEHFDEFQEAFLGAGDFVALIRKRLFSPPQKDEAAQSLNTFQAFTQQFEALQLSQKKQAKLESSPDTPRFRSKL